MTAKDDFEFLNSEVFLKYTQTNYRTLEETRFRLQQSQKSNDWKELNAKIIRVRKTGAIPFFLETIGKKFWFYPADCIIQKAHEVEKLGLELYEKINSQSAFATDFLIDATIEEAITSAIYEGANSTRAKAKELIETKVTPKSKDEWMILNNYRAMHWTKENKNREVSPSTIREIHEIITRNTLTGDDLNFSGKFRDGAVFVHSLNEVKHEGIDFSKIEVALEEAVALTTKNTRYFPPLLKGIILHYFISYIHPFFDGNGRTARTLFYFKSIKNNLRFMEILSVSAYLKNHGKQYEKSFEKVVQNELDLTYFIDFNLDALKEALEKVQNKVDYLLKITTLKTTLQINDNQIGLLQKLAIHNFRKTSIEQYASSINKSREVARQELRQLADLKILEETKMGKKFVYQVNKDKLDNLLYLE